MSKQRYNHHTSSSKSWVVNTCEGKRLIQDYKWTHLQTTCWPKLWKAYLKKLHLNVLLKARNKLGFLNSFAASDNSIFQLLICRKTHTYKHTENTLLLFFFSFHQTLFNVENLTMNFFFTFPIYQWWARWDFPVVPRTNLSVEIHASYRVETPVTANWKQRKYWSLSRYHRKKKRKKKIVTKKINDWTGQQRA